MGTNLIFRFAFKLFNAPPQISLNITIYLRNCESTLHNVIVLIVKTIRTFDRLFQFLSVDHIETYIIWTMNTEMRGNLTH